MAAVTSQGHKLVQRMGLDPTTYSLQGSCTAIVLRAAKLAPPWAVAGDVTALSTRLPRRMERNIGFEPMTNSLEGCDSTPELIPHEIGEQGGIQTPIGSYVMGLQPTAALIASAACPIKISKPGPDNPVPN